MAISHYKIQGVVTAEEPIHVGSGRLTGIIKHSLPYIPGSFIRGAAGSTLVRSICRLDKPLANHEGCTFYEECEYPRLFEEKNRSSKIFFRYAYPIHLKCGGVYRPAPKTLYHCENSQCGMFFDTMNPPDKCHLCQGRVKPYTGFVCDKCGDKNPKPITLTRFTSTSIDRLRSSAAIISGTGEESGTLHTLEAIPEGSRFRFEAIIHRDLEADLRRLTSVIEKGLPDEGVGGSRSRGFGRVSVRDVQVQEVKAEDVEKRAEEIDAGRFSVESLSPLVLGGVLEVKTLLEGARRAYSWVFHEDKPRLPEVVLEASRLSVESYGGWSLKDSRRRRIEQAVSAGSVFQFSCESVGEKLAESLAALEVYPLGDYKPHGCGQLKVGGAR